MGSSNIIASLTSLLIGGVISGLIGGLLIMLGSKIVMGSAAKFGSAFVAALVATIAGFVLGLVIGFAFAAAHLGSAQIAQIAGGIAGFLATPPIYAAIIRTGDGRTPSLVQAFLIYLIQLVIALVVIGTAIYVFKIPIPTMGA